MLLGIVIDKRGLVPDADMKRIEEFGNAIKRFYSSPVADISGSGNTYEIQLEKPLVIDRIILQEDISKGERVLSYKVRGELDGKWVDLCSGTNIGHLMHKNFQN